MIKRSQYMNGEVAHTEYYAQFVTPAVKRLVQQVIGLDRIKASQNPYFNDIDLPLWDQMYFNIKMECGAMFKEANEGNALSSTVCVAKTAAKQLAAEHS